MSQESTRDARAAMMAPPSAAPSRRSAWRQFARWLHEEVVVAPLVPVLHPSPLRMKGLGLFTLLGHPLFWFVWAVWLPQPYENLPLRILTAATGLLLISNRISSDPTSRLSGQVFTVVFWFELPFLFCYMYFCNGGNQAWLASMAAMILTYYFSTDWRIATAGLALGAVLARLCFAIWGPDLPPITGDLLWTNLMVISFCVSMGMLLGVSSANLRREHLAHTLTTMGIMAHELRTPLATMALIGDAMRGAAAQPPPVAGEQLEQLSRRLHMLVRNMNHQIDMQIANARLMRLPGLKEAVSAAALVRGAVADYPFRSTRERQSVSLTITRDFRFQGSQALFSQVLDNLMKNALRSLAAAGNASEAGDLAIEVDAVADKGRIIFSDKGVGVAHEMQPRIFEPFFSTYSGTGHGLGLAFCQQVIHSSRGTIRVTSEPGRGATFIIELPILH
ncbi:MAG: HAMP domain-containing sensor histidine kinase [Ramlibacter sp.]|nr:HAMP domain-containing sensor histidine kinase [Ramlibacter sp.]